MNNIFVHLLFCIIILFLIPIFDNILKNIKAMFNGRKTTHFLQTYFDIIKLMRKETLLSQYTSFISYIGPVIIIANSLIFFFLVPIVRSYFDINIIYLFYILTLGNFFMIAYAMDNSTYFAGLGVEREFFLLSVVETSLILMIVILNMLGGHSNISGIGQIFDVSHFSIFDILFYMILFVVFFYIIVSENKRFPFDNPATHLELTMIHEAMLLETQGKQLAILEIASKIKMYAFILIFVWIFLPFTFGLTNMAFLFVLWIFKILFIVFLIASWEAIITKIRVFKYQEVFGIIFFTQILLIIFYIFK